jgi:dTDP-4-dehydrorhamnose 3,5-epimerase-like enzyme
MRVTIERIAVHRDARGSVFEPLTLNELVAQRNAHVVVTEPGGIRGNHYHLRGTEIIAVLGPVLIRLRDGDERTELKIAEGEVIKLTIPPGVAHAFKNTGRTATAMVAFNTREHDPANPDTVREVLIES